MEQDTFFITEIKEETEETPFISNRADRTESHQKPSISNSVKDRIESHQTKRRKTMKVTNVEKSLLAKLVEQEPVLWDRNNQFHCNNHALSAAWSRIASEMSGRNVADCKTIWKSLKDAVRYRKNKTAKTTDGTDEPRDEYDTDSYWELSHCMSFIMNDTSPYSLPPKRLPRRSYPMECENSQTSETRNNSTDSTNTSTLVDTEATNDDTSVSESNYSGTAQMKEQEHDPLLVESMVSMAKSIMQLANEATAKQDRYEKNELKFGYIWGNLDRFFEKLPPEDVDELNLKFIQMAHDKVLKAKRSKV